MANEYMYSSKKDLLMLAQEVNALLSCAAYLSTVRGEQERLHLMAITGIAHRLSDELANSLDVAFVMQAEGQEAENDQ